MAQDAIKGRSIRKHEKKKKRRKNRYKMRMVYRR